MLVKIEKLFVLVGLTVLTLSAGELWFWDIIPEQVHTFLRGGRPGGVIVGISFMLGLIGIFLFPINIIFKRRIGWKFRLLLVSILFVGLGIFGNFV